MQVTVLKPFSYKRQPLKEGQVLDMPEGSVKVYEKIGFVKRVEEGKAPAKPAKKTKKN